MTDAGAERQKVKEITEKLEQGLQEMFESDRYKTYLNTMSKFHNYSFRNNMLITMQRPDATLVAGFRAWQQNFERHVKKGERGIRILAPTPYIIKEEREKVDPLTREPVVDKDGMPVMEEVEVRIPAFQVVTVFDVNQTEGKELPDLEVKELTEDMDRYWDFMQALSEISPVPIIHENLLGEEKGYYDQERKFISIKRGMSESQTAKTSVHEVSHAILHDLDLNQKEIDLTDRRTKEVQAESIAYIVCQRFGIDTSDYSFGYIASWSSGRDMKELKASLNTIQKTASELVTRIESRMQALQKEREKENTERVEDTPVNENPDSFSIYQLNDSEEARDLHFMSMAYLEQKGILVLKENYDLIYMAPLEEGMDLEGIYTMLNRDHPADYRGHSLSVSDVVVLQQNGETSCHFVDSIGFRELPDFLQERQPERIQHDKQEKISYYVIGDQATWTESSESRSVPERFEDLYDALGAFCRQKAKCSEYLDDKARTTLGISINGREFDLLHVREGENYLVQDLTLSETAEESKRFFEDLQTIHDVIGFDKTRIRREMTPEEVKDFVKRRFEYQLKSGGIEDTSLYMKRFDSLYEKGTMETLMPTANQRHVTDIVSVPEWENPYLVSREPEQLACAFGERFISIQTSEDGYDYSILDGAYRLLDGGSYDNPDIPIKAALKDILEDIMVPGEVLLPVDYDILTERAERAGQEQLAERIWKEVPDVVTMKAMPNVGKKENEQDNTVVTLTVSECGEFHNFGEYHEGIGSVEEALDIYRKIPPQRRNGIPSIGINIHTKGTDTYEDVQIDLFSGRVIDLEILDYIPQIAGNRKAMELIAELVEKLTGAEVRGSLEKYNPLAKVEELEEGNYNMIDGVLNNEKPRKESDCPAGRISIKEKLAEKKAVVERRGRDGKPQQETEKKTEREI